MSASFPFDEQVSRFWDRYGAVLGLNGVKSSAARWYMLRFEEYVKGSKLLDHRIDDVVSYLQAVGIDRHLETWQMTQIVHALQSLFAN